MSDLRQPGNYEDPVAGHSATANPDTREYSVERAATMEALVGDYRRSHGGCDNKWSELDPRCSLCLRADELLKGKP